MELYYSQPFPLGMLQEQNVESVCEMVGRPEHDQTRRLLQLIDQVIKQREDSYLVTSLVFHERSDEMRIL